MQLQQDNGTPVLTGTQTKANFVGSDFDLVRNFLVGSALSNFLRMMGWIADGQVTLSGTPTVTIANLS
jgi:hypothetical protein